MNNQTVSTTRTQTIFRIILGSIMVLAAIGHLTFQRDEFQAQVPNWVPLGKDLVVILSGLVELGFGLSMIFWKKQSITIGIALAVFYILIFPGNIAQYLNGTDAFGLDTDTKRLVRLFFQPVLVIWALWSTGALKYIKSKF
ncbi:DoxX family protein [Formosa sp. 3Alg 14/1]|uniref:DoxX family protein n=1 Tax=Formosa sp. 3Alg 14/1 TaxID=3382190 RepID=UPI0039BDA8B9